MLLRIFYLYSFLLIFNNFLTIRIEGPKVLVALNPHCSYPHGGGYVSGNSHSILFVAMGGRTKCPNNCPACCSKSYRSSPKPNCRRIQVKTKRSYFKRHCQ